MHLRVHPAGGAGGTCHVSYVLGLRGVNIRGICETGALSGGEGREIGYYAHSVAWFWFSSQSAPPQKPETPEPPRPAAPEPP
ncbi:hypothetical protein FGB62_270g03 [Gracilaria domingensis]|nr:hypothetical protein FGB62_270g03 [Gracilaria domingensis]